MENFGLHSACNEVSLDKIKYLLKKGEDVNKRDNFKQTPLHCLISSRSIWSYPGMNSAISLDKDSKLKVAEFLLENKANPNMISHNGTGSTPLHVATNIGDNKMIDLLLKYGAKPWFRNGEGKTVLHIATQRGNTHLVQKFLDIGLGPNSIDYKGRTPLHDVNQCAEVIQQLIRNGSNPNWIDYKCKTPLHYYIKNKEYLCCQIILENGANVNIQCENGYSALHYAVNTCDVKFVNLMLSYQADIDSKNNKGYTPLHLAVNKGEIKIIKLLLKNHANINLLNNACDTPLHLAAQRATPNVEIVSTLLDYEPDLRIVNEDGKTPLDYPKAKHYDPQVRKLLVCHALKLKASKLMIFDKNTDFYLNNFDPVYYKQCLNEVNLLKNKDIFKVLLMPTYKLTNALKNDKFERKMFSVNYSKEFSIYCKMLERRFKLALDRKRLLTLTEKCLDLLFKHSGYDLPRLPPECFRFIHNYFNNRDMKMFIKCII